MVGSVSTVSGDSKGFKKLRKQKQFHSKEAKKFKKN